MWNTIWLPFQITEKILFFDSMSVTVDKDRRSKFLREYFNTPFRSCFTEQRKLGFRSIKILLFKHENNFCLNESYLHWNIIINSFPLFDDKVWNQNGTTYSFSFVCIHLLNYAGSWFMVKGNGFWGYASSRVGQKRKQTVSSCFLFSSY